MHTAVRDTELAEQLVEVPTIVSYSLLQRTMEQHVNIPVPGGGGRLADLPGFPLGQSSTATHSPEERISDRIVEQIVDIPVSGGGFQDFRTGQSSSSVSRSPTDWLNTEDEASHVKASIFCNVSARSRHFVNVDVFFLPCVCDSFCVSTFSLGQGCRSFCHELYEHSTVVFCKSGRDACFTIVCILCADHVFWYPWFPCRDFNSCVFFPFGLHANIVECMCC